MSRCQSLHPVTACRQHLWQITALMPLLPLDAYLLCLHRYIGSRIYSQLISEWRYDMQSVITIYNTVPDRVGLSDAFGSIFREHLGRHAYIGHFQHLIWFFRLLRNRVGYRNLGPFFCAPATRGVSHLVRRSSCGQTQHC